MENARDMWNGRLLPQTRIPWSTLMGTHGNPKTATLIGSDKGGIGKSMIAMIMALAHDRAGRPLKIIEIDHQAKLRSVLGDRVDLSLKAGADLADVAKRSEEHTSELQSLMRISYAVSCLKKKRPIPSQTINKK